MEKLTETMIVNAICEYLETRKLFFWRSNNIPVFDTKSQSMRAFPKYSLKGVPDITVIYNGDYIGLEVKTSIGTQSIEQKEFEELCFKNGGRYHIVRSIDDVQRLDL